MKKFLVFFTFVLLFSSCSEYQNALKSEDVAVKYEAAEKMFEAKKYSKAIRLFEQIAPAYKGKPSAEKMFYMYSQSLYLTKQYYSAGYQFESFVANYPKSQKLEEASFLGAKCYSKLSPVYSLDQIDTYKAIDKIQAFIDEYPESTYLAEANIVAKDLREKLEKKAFEVAKQYNTTVENLKAYNKVDTLAEIDPGTELIISNAKEFKGMLRKLAGTNKKLNGYVASIDNPALSKNLLYKL
jgi:outer membrane protein assembly factor BamD